MKTLHYYLLLIIIACNNGSTLAMGTSSNLEKEDSSSSISIWFDNTKQDSSESTVNQQTPSEQSNSSLDLLALNSTDRLAALTCNDDQPQTTNTTNRLHPSLQQAAHDAFIERHKLTRKNLESLQEGSIMQAFEEEDNN